MFSDILTPLTGMNVPFDILAKEGPVVASPVRGTAAAAAARAHARSC